MISLEFVFKVLPSMEIEDRIFTFQRFAKLSFLLEKSTLLPFIVANESSLLKATAPRLLPDFAKA